MPGGLPQMGYCSKLDGIQRVRVNYDPNKHDSDQCDVLVDDDGNEYAYEEVKDCRMHFDTELKFDPSGENDRTRCQPPLSEGKIPFDKNGLPRYHGRRNHLR
eukprot:545459-Ditylum_brightwellii.AAC.1